MMNTKIKTNRLLVVAIIGLIFISSFIGSIIGSIIYDSAIFVWWCWIVTIIGMAELLFENLHKTKDTKASELHVRVTLKLLTIPLVLLYVHWAAQQFGIIAELIVGIVGCLLAKKAIKYIDEDENE